MKETIQSFKPNANFFKNTFCVFYEKDLEEIKNIAIDYKSDSGSIYYYTAVGMYRYSNHWGRLANCKWRLVENNLQKESKWKLGFAKWNDFYPDNKIDRLYYLDFDFETHEVLYQHKNNPNYDGKALLRTSEETMKRIKTTRNILSLTNWAKYFENYNIDDLRLIIVKELIQTNKSIEQIKKEILEK